MSFHYKVMLLVVAVLAITLWLLRPVFVPLMGDELYRRRASVWVLLTLIAYLSPNILVYSVVGGFLIFRASRKDINPAGLYLLLMLAVPSARVPLPTFGIINNLLDFSHLRLLSLVLLMPLSFQLMRLSDALKPGKISTDWLLWTYLGLQIVLSLPSASATSMMRNLLIMYLDIWLPYFVLSRAFLNREQLSDALACLAMAGLALAPLAGIETVSTWILYAVIPEGWGAGIFSVYRLRDGLLRAGLTAGQPIAMGYFFALAFGAWLYVRSRVAPGMALAATLALLAGLFFPLSKGPWLGAAVIFLTFIALGPKPLGKLVKTILFVALVATIALATPLGDRFIGESPVVGAASESSFLYRQRLLDASLLLLAQSPFFGVPNFLRYMEELRQGEGIIDLVNTYLIIALSYGGIALVLFLSVLCTVLYKVYRETRAQARSDEDATLIGCSVIACIVGSFVMIGTVSPISFIPYSLWALAGIGLSYCRALGLDSGVGVRWPRQHPAVTAQAPVP
jgi:O-antigen ligase